MDQDKLIGALDALARSLERERLAGHALAGILAHQGWQTRADLVAKKAVEYADAVLAEMEGAQ